jgi:hypothetical protein
LSKERFSVLEGFYKVRYQVDEAVGRSVMYAHNGKMLGGNSAFAHYGDFEEIDGEVVSQITSHRHNDDPNYKSLLGADIAKIDVRGRAEGNIYHFIGSSPQMPGAVFRSMMTPLDETISEAGAVGEGGIVNGLYSVHIRMLDGIDGGLTGVMLLNEGRILGGDAFFYYLGGYTSANGRWKGQILNQEHTPAKGEHPIFGGYEVGIGFAGSCDAQSAELEATALAGKRSLRLKAVLKLMLPA